MVGIAARDILPAVAGHSRNLRHGGLGQRRPRLIGLSKCRAQASDVRAPSLHQWVGFRVVAFASDAPLAECKLVLRIHQSREDLWIA